MHGTYAQTTTASNTCVYPVTPVGQFVNLTGTDLLELDLQPFIDTYTGKVALVFGCSSNKSIGRETAKLLTRIGMKVMCSARTRRHMVPQLEELTNMGIDYVGADVTDERSLNQLKRQMLRSDDYSTIDLVFNAAGFGYFGDMNDMTIEDVRQVMLTNGNGALNIWLTFKSMLAVNATFGFVSSSTAFQLNTQATYSASKEALRRHMIHLSWFNSEATLGSRPDVKFIEVTPAATNTNVMLNALRPSDPACPNRWNLLYSVTRSILATIGQPAWKPAYEFLFATLTAKRGEYTPVHSSTDAAAYMQYQTLAEAYAKNQPQEAIRFFNSYFGRGNPFSLPC